jgi:hypothetical protein
MYRFFNKLSKNYRNGFSNELVEKIVRRDTDTLYYVDDLYLTTSEKEELKYMLPPTFSFTSKDDLIWFAKNNKIKLPAFVTNTELQRVRSEEAAAFFNNQNKTVDSCKYSILITEATKPDTMTFSEYINNVLSVNIADHVQHFMTIYFQICIACYALSLTKTNHNDLHTGNVFVTKLASPDTIDIYINDKKYSFVTSYIVTLYDFDRAFVKRFGPNQMLQDYICEAGQCNKFNEKLDIFKVSCYFSKAPSIATQTFLMSNIYPLLASNENNLRWLQRSYLGWPRCFFQQDDLQLETRLNSYPQIIENVFSKISKPRTLLPTQFVYYLNSTYFSSDGTLNVEAQQNAIERLTGKKPKIRPVDDVVIPAPVKKRPVEIPVPVTRKPVAERLDRPMEIESLSLDGYKSRKQKKSGGMRKKTIKSRKQKRSPK